MEQHALHYGKQTTKEVLMNNPTNCCWNLAMFKALLTHDKSITKYCSTFLGSVVIMLCF
jgi:hypothetical protein